MSMEKETNLMDSMLKKIKGTVLSEKSMNMSKEGVMTFKFDKKINKNQIKDICSSILGVEVLRVNTCNVNGKKKVFKGIRGSRASWKKAFVKISKNDIEKIKGAIS